jgi:hypothetical protein
MTAPVLVLNKLEQPIKQRSCASAVSADSLIFYPGSLSMKIRAEKNHNFQKCLSYFLIQTKFVIFIQISSYSHITFDVKAETTL